MIKANDLRVDNFVIYKIDGENKICQIEGITKEYVELIVVDPLDFLEDEIPIERCKPIPLTPEWLERCGFVKRDSKTAGVDLYGLGNITIEHEIDAEKYNSALFALAFDQDGLIVYPLSYHPEHLHQLQNIYFWFTGEELNMRL